ncbi:MAG: aminomethyltransferase family protein [Planctomycetes bacterium]|nr:aminomethyltransferase family protein [Planctomycetota bacterium]
MNASPLLALHEAAGARLLPAGTPAPLLTYGDVPGEYRAARESAVLFDECDRGAVRVDGAEAPEFLHRLLANRVLDLVPGQGVRNMLLSPQGKVRFLFDVARTEAGFTLSTAPGDAPRLVQALDMFLFAEAIELEDVSEAHAPLCLVGPRATEELTNALGVAAPTERYASVDCELDGTAIRVTHVARFGSPAWRIDAGAAGVEQVWKALVTAGARPAGRVVSDSLRAEACTAEAGVDIDDTVYPQEARLESAFSLEKGCYIGQEVVAKIDTYGGLNKRLVCLRVSHDDPVAPGTQLERHDEQKGEWRALGVVTSWAYSFELDGGIVLAYVKRRHQAVGTEFRLNDGSGTATVVASPVRPDALPVSGEFE